MPSKQSRTLQCALETRVSLLPVLRIAHAMSAKAEVPSIFMVSVGMAWLMEMVVQNSKLVQAVAAVLDQQLCAALDAHIHREDEETLKQKVEAPHMLEKKQLLPPLPDDPEEAAREIERYASEVFGKIQIDRCLIASCGKPPGGKSGCRFGLPSAAGEGDNETCPHLFVVYHTP